MRADRALLAGCMLAASVAAASALAAEPAHALRQMGRELVFHYGLVPAEGVLAHAGEHPERGMHGGAPGSGESHLMVALFDAATKKRVSEAEVSVTVTLFGGSSVTRRLEPMTIAGRPSFGGFFSFGAPGIYRIRFEARRAAADGLASAEFEHRVPGPEGQR